MSVEHLDTVEEMEAILRKLNYHESIIEKLLTFPCSNLSTKISLLERKILSLEALVLEIPNYGEPYHWDLFVEWTDTVLELWRRHFLIANGENIEGCDGGNPADGSSMTTMATMATSTTNPGRSNNNKQQQRALSSSANGAAGGRPLAKGGRSRAPGQVKQTYRSLNFRRRVEPVHNVEEQPMMDAEQMKEHLKSQLEESFAKLTTVEQLSDLEAMQALLRLVARSLKDLMPYSADKELQSEILGFALPKVPVQVVERFNECAEDVEEKTLRMLKKCLIEELAAYYADLKESLKANTAAAANVGEAGDAGEVDGDLRTCFYCKATNHISYRCPEREKFLCFRCFAPGHKAKDCGRRCHKCGRLGHWKKYCKN